MQREKFSSRLGFLLISAGCAIGLGNVWRFPYITGQYGGAAFVILYLAFLLFMGLPVMVMELSVGRASQKSIAQSFDVLEKNLTALREGHVQLLIAQHTDSQTVAAVNALVDHILMNQPVAKKDNFTQMDILNRYNCDYYL